MHRHSLCWALAQFEYKYALYIKRLCSWSVCGFCMINNYPGLNFIIKDLNTALIQTLANQLFTYSAFLFFTKCIQLTLIYIWKGILQILPLHLSLICLKYEGFSNNYFGLYLSEINWFWFFIPRNVSLVSILTYFTCLCMLQNIGAAINQK